MNFDERANRIGAMLREILFRRYEAPRGRDEATLRTIAAEMVDDLNRAWPVSGAAQFDATMQEFLRALRTTYTGREWPSTAIMLKALKEVARAKVEESRPRDGQELGHVYDLVLDWWRKFHDPMPGLAKPAHSLRMIREGVATVVELHAAGFPLDKSLYVDGWREAWRDPEHGRRLADIQATRRPDSVSPSAHGKTFRSVSEIASQGLAQ